MIVNCGRDGSLCKSHSNFSRPGGYAIQIFYVIVVLHELLPLSVTKESDGIYRRGYISERLRHPHRGARWKRTISVEPLSNFKGLNSYSLSPGWMGESRKMPLYVLFQGYRWPSLRFFTQKLAWEFLAVSWRLHTWQPCWECPGRRVTGGHGGQALQTGLGEGFLESCWNHHNQDLERRQEAWLN